MSQQGPHVSPHSIAKTNVKAYFSERTESSGISDLLFASEYSEKFRLKKLMVKIIIIIINNCKKRRFLAGTIN